MKRNIVPREFNDWQKQYGMSIPNGAKVHNDRLFLYWDYNIFLIEQGELTPVRIHREA